MTTPESALRDREEVYGAIVNQAAEGIVLIDAETLRFVEFNDAACAELGYTREEFGRLTLLDIQGVLDEGEVSARIRNVLRAGEAHFVNTHRRKDGVLRDTEISKHVVRLRGRDYFASTWRDVTESNQAERNLAQSEQHLRTMLRTTMDGFWVADPQGRFLDVNDAFCAMTGYTRDEILGMGIPDVEAVESAAEVMAHILEITRRGSHRFESRHRRKDGRILDVEVSATSMDLGGGRVVCFCRDITERKQLEVERGISMRLLQISNTTTGLRDLMRDVTLLLRDWSGCEAVGIRIREGDDFPYIEARGFPPDFIHAENSLCVRDPQGEPVRDVQGNPVLECMCGNVLCGRFNPEKPFFTGRGSFWSNGTTELLASTTDADRQARTRNRCNGEGYESVALVAIRTGETVHGLLQFNDRRKDRFSQERIAHFERVADQLASIVAHRQGQEDLARSERRYRSLVETTFDWIWEVDAGGTYTYVSPKVKDFLGYEPEEVVGRTPFDLMPEDEARRVGEIFGTIAAEQRPFAGLENVNLHRNGRRVVLETSGVPVFGPHGQFQGYRGSDRDITRRKEAETAIAARLELEARLSKLAATVPGAVYAFRMRPDGSFHFPYAAPSFAEICGIAPAGLVDDAASAFAAIHPDDLLRVLGSIQQSGRTLSPWQEEFRVRHPRRGEVWAEGRAAPEPEPDGGILWHGFLHDVTTRKRTEFELRRRDAQLEEAQRTARIGSWEWDVGSDATTWSAEMYRLIDVDPQSAPLDFAGFLARVHPEDRDRFIRIHERALETHEPFEIDFRVLTPGAEVRWVHGSGQALTDEAGRPERLRGTMQDITDRMGAEEALNRFVSSSPAVIYALAEESGQLRLKWTSENLVQLTGYERGEVDEAWWYANLHPDDRERVLAAQPVPYDIEHQVLEFRFRRKDGSYAWIQDEKRLLRGADGRPTEIVGSWSDVTARVELEEQLRQSQKMEAIGRLAGGVAHDFNNLLTVITGYSELLLQMLPPDDSKARYVGDIRDAGERAAALTRQLLAFSRKQLLEPRVLDLNDVVRDLDKMLRRLIGEDVVLTTVLSPDAAAVKVDPGQIEQVVINLAVNSRDAMPGGGRLTIETRTVELGEEECRVHCDARPGLYTRISVSDTGCGMTPEIKARIFEPFFTTKAPGKGTGLGLATVFGIIKQSEGLVEVDSHVGEGTCFRIFLPAADAEAVARRDGAGAEAVLEGRETILLVEDEAGVRGIARKALQARGYNVLEASDGWAAIATAEGCGVPIDLLVTDVVMPEVSGPKLADLLRERRAGLKVLFVSGYTDDLIDERGGLREREAFLQKPFSPAVLARKVRAVLDARS